MKVKRLTMRSFRGIDNLTLDFDPNITVLIGNNGAGKSSTIHCLSILLSPLLEWIPLDMEALGDFENILPRGFCDDDISSLEDGTRNEITVILGGEEVAWFIWSMPGDEESGQDECIQEENRKSVKQLKKVISATHFSFCKFETSIPLAVLYAVNRTVLDESFKTSERYKFSQVEAYEGALTGAKVNFGNFFKWFQALEDLENEEFRVNSSHRNPQLEAVRKAFPEFLTGFSNLRVRRSPLRMTVQKRGRELILNQLSDGEKCLLAMVGDLARRLAIANPGLLDPLQGEGVVLIDEIELHLHPEWQRRIIPSLTQTFPNCQFIITTHSPQILGEIKNGIVYRLSSSPKGIVAEKMQTYGRDSNQILEDIMDVSERSPTFKNDLRRLFRLIEDGKLDEAKRLQQELENSIQYDEPEFAKSDALIRRKEVLGR